MLTEPTGANPTARRKDHNCRVGGKRRDIPFSGEKPLDWHSCATAEKPSGTIPWQSLPEPQLLTQAIEMYELILSHLHLYQSEIFSGKAARNSWDSNFFYSPMTFLNILFSSGTPRDPCQACKIHHFRGMLDCRDALWCTISVQLMGI